MGHLLYGSPPTQLDIDDRTLAHLQIVITSKLRRNESFTLTIPADATVGTGRRTLWVHCTIPIQFSYFGSRMPAINGTWIDALMRTANSTRGLYPVPEPEPEPVLEHPAHAA
jgi:hypothetical protein